MEAFVRLCICHLNTLLYVLILPKEHNAYMSLTHFCPSTYMLLLYKCAFVEIKPCTAVGLQTSPSNWPHMDQGVVHMQLVLLKASCLWYSDPQNWCNVLLFFVVLNMAHVYVRTMLSDSEMICSLASCLQDKPLIM